MLSKFKKILSLLLIINFTVFNCFSAFIPQITVQLTNSPSVIFILVSTNTTPTGVNYIYQANSVVPLIYQTTTNLTHSFSGYTVQYVITNTPNFFLFLSGGNGEVSFVIPETNNLYGDLFNNPSVYWLGGSNNIVTNYAVLSISKMGTNILAAMTQK